jgi:hypothetical protein
MITSRFHMMVDNIDKLMNLFTRRRIWSWINMFVCQCTVVDFTGIGRIPIWGANSVPQRNFFPPSNHRGLRNDNQAPWTLNLLFDGVFRSLVPRLPCKRWGEHHIHYRHTDEKKIVLAGVWTPNFQPLARHFIGKATPANNRCVFLSLILRATRWTQFPLVPFITKT